MRKSLVILILLGAFRAAAAQQPSPAPSAGTRVARAVDPRVLRAHLEFLADDALEGRRPGTRGGELAAKYIAAQFERLGLEPAGDSGTYYHRVPIITLTPDPKMTVTAPTRSDLTYRIFDWGRSRPLHLFEARRAIRPDAQVAVGRLPEGQGEFSLIDLPAPFRLELCRPGDGRLELSLERPAVLSAIRGELFVNGISIASGDHFLLEPGETSITGPGAALLAVWR